MLAAVTLGDAILLGYLVTMSLCVWRASPAPSQASCARQLYLCAAALVVGCYAARVAGLPRPVAGFIYRLVLLGVVLVDYLMLRDVLPLVRADSVDTTLVALDVRLFGVEPSLWLERLNRRPVVEWFSFFYFSYFTINVAYFVIVVCASRAGRRTAEFAIGTALVFSIGQLGYLAVPGFGPIRHLAHQFAGPVNGGLFWGLVTRTVSAGSAMKDIFPSLHTAVPTWFTSFAATQARRDRRWLVPAIVTGFFAANIVFSTVFLRWHYLVDVFAGLTLGLGAGWLAPRLAAAEDRWRRRLGLPGAWELAASREG